LSDGSRHDLHVGSVCFLEADKHLHLYPLPS
jgi:hypothetical protein